MALTRQAYAHAKYPWEYSTAELSSLFGITRSNALLTAGPMNDSGWTDAVKMLEQQLRFLSLIAWKREQNFNTNEGNVTCLYTGRGVPSYAVDTITHSGGTLNRLRHWINWLRSDYGLPAWSWSSDFVAGRAVARLNHVKEMWYATGLVKRNLSFSVPDPYGLKLAVWYSSAWEQPLFYPGSTGPFYDSDYDGYTLESQKIWVFDETTRISSVKNYLLFAIDDTTEYSGTEPWHFSGLPDLDDATDVFNYDNPISGELYLSNGEIEGHGNNATWKYVDVTTYHPTSGSGYVYYKAMLTSPTVSDGGYFNGLLINSTAYQPLCLWQTPTSNPY